MLGYKDAQVNTIIELHDSTVAEIANQNGTVIVRFLPAYLHKSEGRPGFDRGTGWVQEAKLSLAHASFSGDCPSLPCNVMNGALAVGEQRCDNEIPVPLESTATAELRLVFDCAHAVIVTSQGVRLELFGEPTYVEEFRP